MNYLEARAVSAVAFATAAVCLLAAAHGEILTNVRLISCDDGPPGEIELTSLSGLSDSGHVIGHAALPGGASGTAIASPGGVITEVARTGDGFAGGTANRFDSLLLDSSGTRVGIRAKLDGIPEFPFADAILTGPVGSVGAFVWEGGTAHGVTPPLTVTTIDSFGMNGAGELAYRINSELVYIDDVPVIEEGLAYPSVAGVGKFSSISSGFLFNNERSILFKGALVPQGGVTNSDNDGLFLRQGGGQFIEIAREGMPAAEVGGATYSSSVEPVSLSDNGKVAVSGRVAGPGYDSLNNGCVWVGDGATLNLLARAGESVPLPGGESAPFRFSSGPKCGVAANGNALLFGALDTNAPNVTFETGTAIWYWNGSSLVPLLRQGDAVPGAGDRTIASIEGSFISPAGSAVIATRLREPTGGGFVTIHEVVWATDPDGSNLRIVIDTDDEFDRGGGDVVRDVEAGSLGSLSSGTVFNRGRVNAQNEVSIDLDLHSGAASLIHCTGVLDLGGVVAPETGMISGQVRIDADGDGDLGDADEGLEGVTIELSPDGGGGSDFTTTDIDGLYSFSEVDPGSYTVVSETLAGYESTADSDGGDPDSIAVTLGASELIEGKDFLDQAVTAPGTLVARLLEDPNGDGDPADASEGIAGAMVALWDVNGDPEQVGVRATGADGRVVFTGQTPGDYVFTTTLAGPLADAGFFITRPEEFREAPVVQSRTSVPQAEETQFLAARKVQVTGFVRDGDNLPSGLADVRVRVLRDEGRTVAMNTDASGMFSLELEPGDYVIEEIDPTGFESVSDSVGSNDNRIPLTLVSGEAHQDLEFVDRRAARSISLHRPTREGIENLNISIGTLPLPAFEPMRPVTTPAILDAQPPVSEGLVADGVTPLLIKFAVPNLSSPTNFTWTCDVSAGGTVVGGIYDHMRARQGGAWVAADEAARSVVLSAEQPSEYAYIIPLDPETLDLPAGSKEIVLSFSLRSDVGIELATRTISLRRPPIALVADYHSGGWSDDFLAELTLTRPDDFIYTRPWSDNQRIITNVYSLDLFIQENWAVTRFDLVAHGGRFLELRDRLEAGSYRSFIDDYRGDYRRVVILGAPNNGSRLTPYLMSLNARLRATEPDAFQFLPSTALRNSHWDQLERYTLERDEPPLNLDPAAKYFTEGDRIFDPSALVFHVLTLIKPAQSSAFRRVGLRGATLSEVLPDGSDGVVDRNSMTSAAPAGNVILPTDDSIAHGEPAGSYGTTMTQTGSAGLGAFVGGLLDFPESANSFRRYVNPRPKSPYAIRDIIEAARDVPAANVVEILRIANAGDGSGQTREFLFELAPEPSQPVVGEIFWTAEIHGVGGATTSGVTVVPDENNPTAVSVLVDPLIPGDVVLFASYETSGGKLAFAKPILVTSQAPLGANLAGIEIAPGEIALRGGDSIAPNIIGIYDDGTRVAKWVTPADITSATSSAPSIVSVDATVAWEAHSPGTATVTINAFGFSTQRDITVAAPPQPITFDQWQAQFFTPAELADPNVTGAALDLDGDTLDLFTEYITGGHPRIPSPDHVPQIRDVDLGGTLVPAFVVRISNQLADEHLVVQRSPDLSMWVEVPQAEPELLATIDRGSFSELWFDLVDLAAGEQYYRLAVNPTDPDGEVTGTTELLFQFYVTNTDYGDRIDDTNFDEFRYGGESPYTPNVMVDFPGPNNRRSSGYGDLDEVLYSSAGPLMVELAADPGHAVRLESFDLAGRFSDRTIASIEIKDVDGTVLWSASDFTAPGTGHAHLDFPDLVIQSSIVRIHIDGVSDGDGNVGIDNIRFHQIVPVDLGNWSMLTFETGAGDGKRIGQDYGDRITAPGNFEPRYLGGGDFTPGIVADYVPDLAAREWQDRFGDLEFGIYSTATTAPHDVVLTADPGSLVRLYGFDMGSVSKTTRFVGLVSVLDGSGNILFSESDVDVGGSRKRFDFSAAPFESQSIVIRFDATNLGAESALVGLSHIAFSEIPDDGGEGGDVHGATVFTFEGFTFVDYGDRVDAPTTGGVTYGGEPSYTPNVEAFFPLSPSPWGSGYGDLIDVIYESSGVLQIDLVADFGHEVQLESFDLASYGADRLVGLVEIVDGDGVVLWSQQNITAPNTGHASLDFAGLGVEANILSIRVDATNLGVNSDEIGLDNLRFQQLDKVDLGDWAMLTFEMGLGSAELVDQGYGDRIASIQNGSFKYFGGGAFTPGIVTEYVPSGAGYHWVSGFGDLKNALYKDDGFAAPFEVRLSADAGQRVRLFGFDMGAFNTVPPILNSVEVLDGSGNVLFSESNAEISTVRTRYDFSLSPLDADEIVIRYDATNLGGQSDDVGIDNITFGQIPD